jgi:hypothetical protein
VGPTGLSFFSYGCTKTKARIVDRHGKTVGFKIGLGAPNDVVAKTV